MKRIAAILVLVLVAIAITGCGITPPTYSSLAGLQNDLTYTYDVSVTNSTLAYPSSVINSDVSLKIEEGDGTYTIKITSNEDGTYTFSTFMNIKGDYLFKDKESEEISSHPFEDIKRTSTTYSIEGSSVKLISTSKTVENETLCTNGRIYKFKYGYEVKYDEDASITYDIDENLVGYDNATLKKSNETIVFAKYNKDFYIDNEMIVFYPKIFSLSDNYSQSFVTIDVVSAVKRSMKYSMTKTIAEGTKSVKGFDGTDNLVNVVPLYISINEKFNGAQLECYYLQAEGANKNVFVEGYTTLNDQMGYLKYKLKEIK